MFASLVSFRAEVRSCFINCQIQSCSLATFLFQTFCMSQIIFNGSTVLVLNNFISLAPHFCNAKQAENQYRFPLCITYPDFKDVVKKFHTNVTKVLKNNIFYIIVLFHIEVTLVTNLAIFDLSRQPFPPSQWVERPLITSDLQAMHGLSLENGCQIVFKREKSS